MLMFDGALEVGANLPHCRELNLLKAAADSGIGVKSIVSTNVPFATLQVRATLEHLILLSEMVVKISCCSAICERRRHYGSAENSIYTLFRCCYGTSRHTGQQ